jgi:hypothetical protein
MTNQAGRPLPAPWIYGRSFALLGKKFPPINALFTATNLLLEFNRSSHI